MSFRLVQQWQGWPLRSQGNQSYHIGIAHRVGSIWIWPISRPRYGWHLENWKPLTIIPAPVPRWTLTRIRVLGYLYLHSNNCSAKTPFLERRYPQNKQHGTCHEWCRSKPSCRYLCLACTQQRTGCWVYRKTWKVTPIAINWSIFWLVFSNESLQIINQTLGKGLTDPE